MGRVTRQEIIDAIVRAATRGFPLYGDERDGDAPPITLENFSIEAQRYGAKALRTRLSRLPRAELDAELNAAAAYLKTIPTLEEIERMANENEARELRERQAELARRPRLQPAILAAAQRYRAQKKSAKEAWHAIKKNPYQSSNGETVCIEDDVMHVRSHDGKQKRSGIKLDHWRRRYWRVARS